MGDPIDELRRWTTQGGHWQVLARDEDALTIGLFTCDGGEEMGRLRVAASAAAAAGLDRDPDDTPPGDVSAGGGPGTSGG